jgi:hypothetical protein
MKLVITQHRPVRKVLVLVGFVGAAFLAIAIAVDYGHWKSIAEAMVSTGKKRSLLQEVAQLRREREDLMFELAKFRRTDEINRHTREDNHEQLVRLQSEIASLNQELDFYRDVVRATEVESGPKVKGIQIKTLNGEGRYSYRVMLTHVDKDDRVAEGKLDIGFLGEMQGERKALSFLDVMESGPDALSFKFKHFRLFEGTIKMPDGFIPRQIRIAVNNKRRSKGSFSETYDWTSLLN